MTKLNIDSQHFLLSGYIGNFKKILPDILYDYKIIMQHMKIFSITALYDDLCKANEKPICKNRVYIMVGKRIVLMMYNLDEAVFNNLLPKIHNPEYQEELYNETSYDHRIHLILFKNNKLLSVEQIEPSNLADYLVAFYKENNVNYIGVRNDFYRFPRLREKRVKILNNSTTACII